MRTSKIIQKCIDDKWERILNTQYENLGMEDCELCIVFLNKEAKNYNDRCEMCPLSIHKCPCTDEHSPYADFEEVESDYSWEETKYKKAAQAMIDILLKIKKIYEEKGD